MADKGLPKVTGGTDESVLRLTLRFTATGDTEPLPARVITELLENYIAVEMSAARVRINIEEANLNYVLPYAMRRDAVEQQAKDALS